MPVPMVNLESKVSKFRVLQSKLGEPSQIWIDDKPLHEVLPMTTKIMVLMEAPNLVKVQIEFVPTEIDFDANASFRLIEVGSEADDAHQRPPA